ncbi:MAG TPA: histidine kinase [Chitinophagaceae bacterium]|nr:histidine kinase [Chitinophagaceae bacterium]
MNKKNILLSACFWIGLYGLWILIFKNHSLAVATTATIEFCYLVFIAGLYYLDAFLLVPHFLYQKKYIQFVLYFLAGVTVAALLRVPVATYLNSHYFNPGKPQPGFYTLFSNSFINILVWVVCLVAGKLVIDKIRFQRYIDTIEKEKTKTELDFLKAQFNPHFLFNSINSIYGHIEKKNSTARNMLLTFSEMLRYQLYECNIEIIAIDKEVNYIKNYVALQQVRKDEGLVVNLQITEQVKGFNITPLLFIAFIENAFKYVSNSDKRESRIDILLDKKENELLFRVFNTKDNAGGTNPHKGGIGMLNAKRRLELLYPQKYTLEVNDCLNTYEVALNLQLQ